MLFSVPLLYNVTNYLPSETILPDKRFITECTSSMSALILLHSRSYRCDFHIVEQSFALPNNKKKCIKNDPRMNRAWKKNTVLCSHIQAVRVTWMNTVHVCRHCFLYLCDYKDKRGNVYRTETEGVFLPVLTFLLPRVSAGLNIPTYCMSSITVIMLKPDIFFSSCILG